MSVIGAKVIIAWLRPQQQLITSSEGTDCLGTQAEVPEETWIQLWTEKQRKQGKRIMWL